jgi:5-methylcytosine-specific restriction endonuclease McrA
VDTITDSFRLLTDAQLLAEVPLLVSRERYATAMLVASLAEVEARKLYLARGYSSLYSYCSEELHLSEGAAYRRMTAAKVVNRFPISLEYLSDGSLSLTTASILAPNLTQANHMDLLNAARRKTRREVERQMAALRPEEPELITIQLRLRRETHDKLRHAQALMRHVVPTGDVAELFDRALDALIERQEKRKLARRRRPRRGRGSGPRSREIPAGVRRAVSRRDEDRCAFVGTQGRCTETAFLEFHHVVPFAKGGPNTIDNIQLRCRAHNQYEGEREFGPPPAADRGG